MKSPFDRSLMTVSSPSGDLKLFSLTVPIFFENVFTSLIGTVNTVLLTCVSENAVAAVSVATSVVTVVTGILGCVSSGLSILMSYALGRNDKNGANSLFCTAILTSLALSLTLGISGALLSGKIMGMFSLKSSVRGLAELYLKIRLLFVFFTSLIAVLTATLRVYGKTRSTFTIGLIINMVNIALSSLVVKGVVMTSSPVRGMAFCAVTAQAVGFVIAAVLCIKTVKPKLRLKPSDCGAILKLGLPNTASGVSYNFSMTVTTAVISMLGTAVINTKVYVGTITAYVPLFGAALTTASLVMGGRLLGMGKIKETQQLIKQNAIIAVIINVLLSLSVLLFSPRLIRLFTDNPAIIKASTMLFLLDVVIEFFRAINNVYGAGLSCSRDVTFASVLSILSCWIIGVLGCYLFSIVLKMGIVGCYLAFICDEGFRATTLVIRWKHGKWKKHLEKAG